MSDPYSNLPADEKRLHKMYLMAEYCATFPDGCTETQLIVYCKGFGNIVPTIMRLLVDVGENGLKLVTKIGHKYYVTDNNYILWGEAKGFRDKIYYTKCQECGSVYNSKLTECYACKAKNNILNELDEDIHTRLIPQPKSQESDKLTTEPNIQTHTNTDNEEPTPPNMRVKEGRKADTRVVKILNQFGAASLGPGRDGKPDVFFESDKDNYCVEVKSVENQVRTESDSVNGYKVGVVSLSRKQWVSLSSFGKANGMEPLMIVEVKIRGAQNLYHFITRDQVDHKLYSTGAKHIRISVHDLPIMSIHSYREGVPLVGEFRL